MGEQNQRQKRPWIGGYVIRDSKGHDLYFIRKQINGRRYDVTTACHTMRAAVKQLERFEADPANYRAGGDAPDAPVLLTEDLAAEFLTWSRDVRRNSGEWLAKQRRYISWWAEKLSGFDLRAGKGGRGVSLTDHILPALQGQANRQHRIAVLKALYSWLRKEKHVLDVTQDPTFQTLTAPPARPEQWKREKTIPREHYQLAREHLAPHWRDGMDVQAGTGWHVMELVRFAKSGSVEPYPRAGTPGIAGVLVCPQTKAGEPIRTAVSADVCNAARRLLERGDYSRERYGMAIASACKAAAIPPFTAGCFRHSVATWAINNGADPATVAAFLNHKSPRTTRRFYATHAVPSKVPTLL